MPTAVKSPFQISGTKLVKYSGDASCLTIPAGVVEVGDGAFLACNSLQQVCIPEGVRAIGASAFQACRNLQSVTLPDSLERLEESAFNGCTGLKELSLPPKIDVLSRYLCANCTGLERVTLPDGAERVDWRAFYGCSRLRTVQLPAGLRKIGEEAFAGCAALTRMEIPDSVLEIGCGAFARCVGLERVTLSPRLTSILADTFAESGLRWLEIPQSVSRIDFTAFRRCDGLEMLVVDGVCGNIVNYGDGNPLTAQADAPMFFRVPQTVVPEMRRNLFRGYAREKLEGRTTPLQDRAYRKEIVAAVDAVCLWALEDLPLLRLLMQERLVGVAKMEELLQKLAKSGKHEMMAVLLDELGENRSGHGGVDPMEIFHLKEL